MFRIDKFCGMPYNGITVKIQAEAKMATMTKDGAELNSQINEMIEKIAETKASETFQKWVKFLADGHAYSFGNYVWIVVQRPDFTDVRSYNAWKKYKRHVVAGAKGIKILYPFAWYHKYDAAGNKIAWSDKKTRVARKEFGGLSYGVGHVFDIADTDGEPLPVAQWYSTIENDAVFDKLAEFAKANGISIELREKIDGARGARGASYGGKIELISRGVKTLVHELAHELLHKNETEKTDRAQREREAEMVAYIVCLRFGIDCTDTSAVYLANWGADGASIRKSTERIAKAVRQITDGISGESDNADD